MQRNWPVSGLFPCRLNPVMNFKIDENLPSEVADLLQRAGHQATTVPEQRLTGAADADLIGLCKSEGLTLITLDVDFADIRAYPPSEYPGIVVMRLSHQEKNHVLETVPLFVQMISSEPLEGRLWVVEEHRVRIRE